MRISNFLNLHNNPIIPNTLDSSLSFLSDYRTDHEYIDKHFINLYGDLATDSNMYAYDIGGDIDIELTANKIKSAILGALLVHKNDLTRMYNDCKEEYNVLNNYDKTSTIITKSDKIQTTNVNGAIHSTMTNDKIKTDTANSGTGYDSESLKLTDKISSETSGTGTNGKIVNENIVNSVTNTSTVTGTGTDGKRVDEVTEHTHGNIGVTTSVQMLEQDLNLWQNINFFNYMFEIIFKAIALPQYEMEW